MTTTVTVSEFREKLSDYLELLMKKGEKVEIVDGRSKKIVVKLVGDMESEPDWDEYIKEVKKLGGKLLTNDDAEDMRRFRKSFDKRFKNARKR